MSLFLQMWEDRDGRKAMSKTNSKGLTTLRQKLRKYMRDFEDDIKGYREVKTCGVERFLWFVCYFRKFPIELTFQN